MSLWVHLDLDIFTSDVIMRIAKADRVVDQVSHAFTYGKLMVSNVMPFFLFHLFYKINCVQSFCMKFICNFLLFDLQLKDVGETIYNDVHHGVQQKDVGEALP